MTQGVQAMFDEAQEHHRAGRRTEAGRLLREILRVEPRHADSLHLLGLIADQDGRPDVAVELIGRAIRLKADRSLYRYHLGNALKSLGRIDAAVAEYERAIVLDPGRAAFHNNLGTALRAQGKLAKAATHFERALVIDPGFAGAHNNLALVFWDQGKFGRARAHFGRAIALDPHQADAHNNLGVMFRDQGRFEEALACFSRAIAIKPDDADAHYNRAELKTFRRGEADLAALEALAGRDDLPAGQAACIHFALAKALEDTGDHGRAFEQLRQANELKRREVDYDEAFALGLFARIATVFDRGRFERFPGAGDPSAVPIFVLGMPRSGSTLIEQILASHPRIQGAGELRDLGLVVRSALESLDKPAPFPEGVAALDEDALRKLGHVYLARLPALAKGRIRIVDKLPGNFLRIGLIRLILPNARIIHSARDPIDTCMSCYSKQFRSGLAFSYDLAELGRYYRGYRQLMAHWRSVLPPGAMLDVAYEEVVEDLEGQARRMIDYCGLPWDDRCTRFHRTERMIKTSAFQVRQPLFRSSLGRWHKYGAGLAPLLAELGK